MAITFDNATGNSVADTIPGFMQIDHVVGSGSDGLLLVALYGGAGGTVVDEVLIANHSLFMTLVDSVNYPANSTPCTLWKLVNPPTGELNIVCFTNNAERLAGVAVSYFGVDQTTPISATAKTEQANANTIQATVSNATAGSWIYACEEGSNLTYASVSGYQDITTKRGGYDDAIVVGDSNGAVATGSRNAGFQGSSNHRGVLAAVIKAAGAAPTSQAAAFFLA